MASNKKAARATIGIDIGGTKSLYALLDERFEVVAEEKLRTKDGKDPAAAFKEGFEKAVKALLREASKRGLEVEFVGAGVAGEIDLREGVVTRAANLDFLDGFNMARVLGKLTDAQVFIANDVHTGLYGECTLGVARKCMDVIGVWLGTGVGGALVVDGKLHLGCSGIAGNLGNYVLHAVDVAPDAPRKEVLDNVASRTAIAGDAAALAAKDHAPKLKKAAGTDVSEIKSGDIAEAIRKGDDIIEKLVRSRAAVVGTAVSNLVDFLNPDMVVLGGGLVEAMPELMQKEISKAVKAHASDGAAACVKIAVAELRDHAGTIGAARLAQDMFSGDPPIEL